MKDSSPFQRRHAWCALLLLTGFLNAPATATPQTLYATAFEAAEGFDAGEPLAGQGGWIRYFTGGNGLFVYDSDFGQSAYIGDLPAATYDGLYLSRPVNFTPTNRPVVTFTVDVAVTVSTASHPYFDEFRWSVYNTNQARLFALGFDNRYDPPVVYYQLDDGSDHDTGWSIENGPLYHLEIKMDFATNRWNAWIGNVQVVTNALITTKNAGRTLGSVDAVWLPTQMGVAGDNFMVFDNYTLTADVLSAPLPTPARLQLLGTVNGQQLIRVTGQTNASYALEGTTNLSNWTVLKTNVATGGYFDFLDTGAVGLKQRFYRARWVP